MNFFIVAFFIFSNDFIVFTLNSLKRITGKEIIEEEIKPIELYLLKNEFESFQIGIKTENNWEAEFVLSKSLASYLKIYQEYFIPIDTPSFALGKSKPESCEKVPDPLIPIEKRITLKKGINIFWFDVYVSENEEKEEVEGEINLKIKDKNLNFLIPVKLNILKINLPKIPSFNTLFVFWLYPIFERQPNVDKYLITRLYYEEALLHKINPSSLPLDIRPKTKELRRNTTGNQQEEISLPIYTADFDVIYSTGRLSDNVEYYRNKNLKIIEVPLFAQKGLLFFQWKNYLEIFSDYFLNKNFNYIVDYSFDEPNPNHYDLIKEWAYNLHKYTKIKNLVTFNNFYFPKVDERLLDDGTGHSSVDIWVPKFSLHSYFKNFFQERKEKGEEIWVYQAGVTDSFTPKWLLDYPLIETRISFWLFFLFDIKGMVYWGIDNWQKNVWQDPKVIIDGKVYNGDGYLLYNGSEIGIDKPIPSIRLKTIRDGIEDYEYLKILRGIDYYSYKNLLQKIASDWYNWTNNGDSLILIKTEIWQKLKSLIKEKKAHLLEEKTTFLSQKIFTTKKLFDPTGKRIKKMGKGVYFIKDKNSFKLVKIN